MENKYYRPEIEEFHIGFEFERALVDCNWSITTWEKEVLKEGTDLKTIAKYPSFNRVKFLDRKDIEEQGLYFERSTIDFNNSDIDLYLNKDMNITLAHHIDSHKISTFTRDPSLCEFYLETNHDPRKINNVTVRNKSELKKILKQIKT